jgi:hypothetical protein
MKRRVLALLVMCLAPLTVATTAAHASGGGSDAVITDNSGGGIPGWFVGLLVLVGILAVGTTIWRVTAARSLARQAGLNPNTATAVTLLGNGGLDAAYLASSLHDRQAPATSADAATRTTEKRLAELHRLKEQGLVTDEEYDAHRKAILGSV